MRTGRKRRLYRTVRQPANYEPNSPLRKVAMQRLQRGENGKRCSFSTQNPRAEPDGPKAFGLGERVLRVAESAFRSDEHDQFAVIRSDRSAGVRGPRLENYAHASMLVMFTEPA